MKTSLFAFIFGTRGECVDEGLKVGKCPGDSVLVDVGFEDRNGYSTVR